MRIVLKDAGNGAVSLSPRPWNAITITRYHVEYIRADGRNTPGVDVPYPFDGGVTATMVGADRVPFEMVRHQRSSNTSTASSRMGGRHIHLHDRAGHVLRKGSGRKYVQITGTISVNFGDFADPQ